MEQYTGYLRTILAKKQDKTYIKDAYFQGAFKITRPVYLDETGQACLYIMNPGGGYLAGDTYRMEVELEQGAEAIVTTQSSTKIYKTANLPAVLETEISLKKDSLLEYLPDSTIAYRHARFRQRTTVRMEDGATLVCADIFTPGWAEDGTLFSYDLIQSKLQVYLHDELVLLDHLKLIPDDAFRGMGSFDGFTHFGSLVAIGEQATEEFIEQLHEAIQAAEPCAKTGISLLSVPGFALRVLANSTQEIEQVIALCHGRIRQGWFDKKPIFLRKY